MEKIEKVIKWLECYTEDGCTDCPYYKNCEVIEKAREEIKWLRGMMKEQVQERISITRSGTTVTGSVLTEKGG